MIAWWWLIPAFAAGAVLTVAGIVWALQGEWFGRK